jgi:hypothetical protein
MCKEKEGVLGFQEALEGLTLALEASTWHVEDSSNPTRALRSNALIRTCSR